MKREAGGEPNLLAKLFCPLQGLFQRKLVSVALCSGLQDLKTQPKATVLKKYAQYHQNISSFKRRREERH